MSHRIIIVIVAYLVLSFIPLPLHARNDFIHHDLKVTVVPGTRRIIATDAITMQEGAPREVSFTIHSGMKLSAATPRVRIIRQGAVQGAVPLERFTAQLPPQLRDFSVSYEGVIDHPVERRGREQARGIDETPGLISAEGVFLSGSSGWYPDFESDFVTFDLEVKLPPGWDAVSQGERTRRDRRKSEVVVRWKSPEPQEEIYLAAAMFTEYTKAAGPATAMVYLRTPDQGLADKYLDAAAGYLALYSELLGPYPYKKFALVENFWESGFGMPSFTLLGATIIRLPFIINSSFPHEILHNWWGNGVFPDFAKGNWSEGLTAYLADHLIREQQGGGAEYRVTTLQKYADYVQSNRDFPLDRFRSRHDPSTEAIGYGKSLMFFHMLRQELGDQLFVSGLRDFYRKYRFRYATFDELRRSFETASGKELRKEFAQWVTRTGAPQLAVKKPLVSAAADGYVLQAQLEQTQPGEAYSLRVPLAVTIEGQERALQTVVEMNGKELAVNIPVPAPPLRLDVDPEYDLFRRLDRDELPPAVSQALGAKRMLVVLPSAADKDLLRGYREFAASLSRSGPDEVDVKLDNDMKALPTDRSVMLLGWENRFAVDLFEALFGYDVSVKDQSVRINGAVVPVKDHSFVLTSRFPRNHSMALSLIAADSPAPLPGLARKLPHYHKYSYLAFEGAEPENVAKGRWPVIDSPLALFVPGKNGLVKKVAMAKLAAREPLAAAQPVFSSERMLETVRFLAADDLGGRGFGAPGLDKAADHIAKEFKDAGLLPGGDTEGGYFQSWEDVGDDPAHSALLKNVIGVLPGAKPELGQQSVVIGAHYDHLGLGWPETRDKSPGAIHPGADDNASGVAVMLELARLLAKGPRPDRTVVFVAFSGEEAGKRGSKRYVLNEERYPVRDCLGMVNLDTVGRLGKNKLLVLGSGSAREWPHIFRGAGFVTGVEIEAVAGDLDSSDQRSFQEAGVPAVQLFSGPNLDYHRSTDTADKIDGAGLVKVASVAREVVVYLAGRPQPLTAVNTAAGAAESLVKGERKAGLGTVPDFTYSGKGFKISGVVPGSPAEKAGLKEDDVIVRMNDVDVDGLKGFSDLLKSMHAGDKVRIQFLRNGSVMTTEAELTGR